MDIVILIIVFLILIIHRRLSTFWEEGTLPYATGFTLFVWIMNIIYMIDFIWLFGFVVGIILTILTFFQITFATILWPFLIPSVIKDIDLEDGFTHNPRVPSGLLYGGWSFLIVGLGILTIINFIIGSYSSFINRILELVDGEYKLIAIYAVIGIIGGNILRIIVMRFLES